MPGPTLRWPARLLLLATVALALMGRSAAQPAATAAERAAGIVALTREAMTRNDLRAVIVRVTVDGKELVTAAMGESLTGVPATPDMHFRNGSVAISYLSMLLLQLVDEGRVTLDDPLSRWLPDLPDAGQVTLRMLANMTAGYPDYVQNERLDEALYADPFRPWTSQELLDIGLSTPRRFAPGTNWDYSHTNCVILGLALQKVTGEPLGVLLQRRILTPLGLTNTRSTSTAEIPEPVLHAYTSERRAALGLSPTARFYEESTYWNPTWTLAEGAVQTTDITDMTKTAEAVGTGALLSPASHQAQVAPDLLGFGAPLAGCPSCHTLDRRYVYGLGVVLNGPWIIQNPLLAGYGSIEAYLPSHKIAVAVVTTFTERNFDAQGHNSAARASSAIFAAIGRYLAPDEPPPAP